MVRTTMTFFLCPGKSVHTDLGRVSRRGSTEINDQGDIYTSAHLVCHLAYLTQ